MLAVSPGKYLFRLFGTPVYGHWSILLLVFLLGRHDLQTHGWVGLFVVALAIFLGLMVHEFGHVYAARTNGFSSFVVLGGLGAYTVSNGESRGWRGVWLSFAGPLFGFLFWALLWFGLAPAGAFSDGLLFDWRAIFSPRALVSHYVGADQLTGGHLLWAHLCWINLVWGIFNLMPIVPLDGGHIVEHLLRMKMRGAAARRTASMLSFGVILGLLPLLYWLLGTLPFFTLLVLGMLAMHNFERLRET